MGNAATGFKANSIMSAFSYPLNFSNNARQMVNRRSNSQLIGWLAPTAHPAHGGTDERPAS
jgi:hypothetical protein